jgi:hypothetical protein
MSESIMFMIIIAIVLMIMVDGMVFMIGVETYEPNWKRVAIAGFFMDASAFIILGFVRAGQGDSFGYMYAGLGIVMFCTVLSLFKDMIETDLKHIIEWIESTRKTKTS